MTCTKRTNAHRVADTRYSKKRELKPVSFNLETESELLNKANALESFSAWVKEKLKELPA